MEKMLTIHSVMPKVSPTESLVYFRRKDTAKQPVAETDKFRGVLIVPPYVLPAASESLHEVFADAISEAFFASAGDILRNFCDANKDAREVSADLFSFSAVVAKMQESQTSQRLNGEQILNWFDGSKTAEDAATRYSHTAAKPDKRFAVLREKYGSLASNNPGGINPQLATKMISYISPDDTDNAVCKALLKKLEKLSVETVDEL